MVRTHSRTKASKTPHPGDDGGNLADISGEYRHRPFLIALAQPRVVREDAAVD